MLCMPDQPPRVRIVSHQDVLGKGLAVMLQEHPGRALLTEGHEADVVLYDYRTGRGSEHPEAFLTGFTGYLQTDGYSGYARLKGVTQLGCWAHARRNEKLDVMAS